MAYTQLKDGRWIVYYRDKNNAGKIKKEYFGRGADAEVAAKNRNEELGITPRKKRQRQGLIFHKLAMHYSDHKNFNSNSQAKLETRLDAHILPAFGNTPAIKITDTHVDNYIKKRRTEKVKDSTIARELSDVKAILNWSVARRPQLIPLNPIRDYKIPKKDDAIISPPTPNETARILKNAPPHLKRAIILSYYIGLRPGAVELLSLTWDRIEWNTGNILIISAKKGGPEKRVVPIHKDFLSKLEEWFKKDKKTFRREKGLIPIVHYRKHAIKSFKTAWKNTLKDAEIVRRLRPYDLRHSFVTKALEEGADIKALSEIVGSRPETIMRHYQHVSNKLRRQTVAKIPPIIEEIKEKDDNS